MSYLRQTGRRYAQQCRPLWRSEACRGPHHPWPGEAAWERQHLHPLTSPPVYLVSAVYLLEYKIEDIMRSDQTPQSTDSATHKHNERMKEGLTISVPLGNGWYVGEIGDHHHCTHQSDGVALHTKRHWEPVKQADIQLTGMDLSQMRHWRTRFATLLAIR